MQTNTLQTDTKDKLGYTPVLSKKFTSFSGVCDEKEFRNAFKTNLVSIVIGMIILLLPMGLPFFFDSEVAGFRFVTLENLCIIFYYLDGHLLEFLYGVLQLLLLLLVLSLLIWEWYNSGFLKIFAKRIHALGGSFTRRIVLPSLCFVVCLYIGTLIGTFVDFSLCGIFIKAFSDVLMYLSIVYIFVIMGKCLQWEKQDVLNYMKRMVKVCLNKIK